MGGCCCCCASKGEELNNASPFYHYPSTAEVHQPLSSHGRVSALSTGLLVDTNLDTSILETYRAPPAPVPYETNVGRPRSPLPNRESHGDKNETVQLTEKSVEETNSGITQETTVKVVESDGNANVELTAAKEVDDDLEKSGELKKPSEPKVKLMPEEEDVCPTCLEEYDAENPKIITKCEHHFHLACILEWMERSETCPVCDQEMVFSIGNDA